MKKKLILLSILSALMFASCTSIPKSVKSGDTLVIGNLECLMIGYNGFQDVKNEGSFKYGIELTITDQKRDQVVKTVKTDENGLFVITGLKPHETYAISKLSLTNTGYSGSTSTFTLNINGSNRKSFIAYDNDIVNIGGTTYTFVGTTNTVVTKDDGYEEAEKLFRQEAAESEWLDKQIYRQ